VVKNIGISGGPFVTFSADALLLWFINRYLRPKREGFEAQNSNQEISKSAIGHLGNAEPYLFATTLRISVYCN